MTIKEGTLVMYKRPPYVVKATSPQSGMIGEVMPVAECDRDEMLAGCLAVFFPSCYAPDTTTGQWMIPPSDLIPISGPDIDIGEEDSVKNTDKKPVEDLV